jgi:hypothetical protein
MILMNALYFAAMLLLVGAALRLLAARWPDSAISKAITFAY